MGWLIALVVLTGLAILPLGVSAIYNTHGPFVYILLGPVRIKLFPAKKKQKSPKTEKPEGKEKTIKVSETNKAKNQEKHGGSISVFFPLLERVLELLGKFRRKLRVNHLEFKLILAGDDPADLAGNYGKAWAVLGNLMPLLERVFLIKERNLEVECDFASEKTLIYGRLDLTITLGRLISLAVIHGVKILREVLKIMKSRKGGATT